MQAGLPRVREKDPRGSPARLIFIDTGRRLSSPSWHAFHHHKTSSEIQPPTDIMPETIHLSIPGSRL